MQLKIQQQISYSEEDGETVKHYHGYQLLYLENGKWLPVPMEEVNVAEEIPN